MTSFSMQEKLESIRRLQKNLGNHAFIANELESRLLEHLPCPILQTKRLDMLRDCSAEVLVTGMLPYQEASFDCIIAHLIPLWQEDLTTFFQTISRILAPNGIFVFSTLGHGIGQELEIIGDTLLKARFQLPVVDKEYFQLQYDNFSVLAQDLEVSGSNCELVQITENSPEDIIVILDVIYGCALGKTIENLSSGKIEVSVKNITLRKIR